MLTSLCSSNVEIVQTALKCLQQMCDEVDIKGSMEDVSDMPVDSNLTTYRDLGDLARAMPTGECFAFISVRWQCSCGYIILARYL